MSKPKNRATTNGMTHAVYRPRRNNYWAQRCNGVVVYNATDEALPLQCLICMVKEQRNGQARNDL